MTAASADPVRPAGEAESICPASSCGSEKEDNGFRMYERPEETVSDPVKHT